MKNFADYSQVSMLESNLKNMQLQSPPREGGGGTTITSSKKQAGSNNTTNNHNQRSFASMSEFLRYSSNSERVKIQHGCSLAMKQLAIQEFEESALLGYASFSSPTASAATSRTIASDENEIYLNTHEPFCLVTLGVQGSGKSHTLGCVLESCMIPIPQEKIITLKAPMTALVLHYDHNITSVCEATGLISPHPAIEQLFGQSFAVPKEKMIVLVSPTYYQQRKAFYGNYCIVKPLLFHWSCLTADHIKRIMRISMNDNQLYVATMLDLLREYQQSGRIPKFQIFIEQIRVLCNVQGQSAALQQRIKLLESIIIDDSIRDHTTSLHTNTRNHMTTMNAVQQDIQRNGCDLYDVCKPGNVIVVDLTDPLLARDEANGIFQVLTEQFRAMPITQASAKVLVLDEAHKYMDGSSGSDGLSGAIVDIARLMRHDGMRLVVSTQSPRALAPELLELVSVAVMHRFHSRDWFQYLSSKLLLHDRYMKSLAELDPGHALVFVSRHMFGADFWSRFDENNNSNHHPQKEEEKHNNNHNNNSSMNVFPLTIRPRITADRGQSRTNVF